ncbi:caspase family protein [Defluviicoccus vanus]|uniref:caspase family protein n=1 Tax=Defluviicoccus vanus TaxID=111831 RepID=UPI001CBA65C8|nr:caspase family protein [Defluviicoccus vanus]
MAAGLVPPVAAVAADTLATKRAMVVAMANYKALPPLPQCPIAARNVAAALRGAGFEVREAFDVSNGELNGTLASFAQQAAPQSTLFTYYCGYAVNYNGRTFLVPVSATLDTPDRIMVEGVVAASFVNVLGRTIPWRRSPLSMWHRRPASLNWSPPRLSPQQRLPRRRRCWRSANQRPEDLATFSPTGCGCRW